MQKVKNIYLALIVCSLLLIVGVFAEIKDVHEKSVADIFKQAEISRRTFKGTDFDIVSDKWEYTSPQGFICYTVTDKRIKTKIEEKANLKALKLEDDIQIDETVVSHKLVGLENFGNLQPQLVAQDENVFTEEEYNQTFCKFYSVPLGTYQKFDIVVGDDVLDPVINVAGFSYNATCLPIFCDWSSYGGQVCGYQYPFTWSGWRVEDDFDIPETRNINFTQWFDCCSQIGKYIDGKIELTYENDSVYTDQWNLCTSHFTCDTPLATRVHNTVAPVKHLKFSMYCSGTSCSAKTNIYTGCPNAYRTNYWLNTTYPIGLVNFTAVGTCNMSDVMASFDNSTWQNLSNPILNATSFGLTEIFFNMNQSTCQWVNAQISSYYIVGLVINIFNQDGQRIYENITTRLTLEDGTFIQNITNSSVAFFRNLNSDSYFIELSGTNYITTTYNISSEYFLNFTESGTSNRTINAYLISNSGTSLTIIKIITQVGQYIDGALITITGNINSSWQTITQKYTDSTGTIVLSLKFAETYRVLISKTGYVLQQGTITPSSNPYDVVLILYKDIAYNMTSPMTCIDAYTYYPTLLNLNQTERNFTIGVFSTAGNIEYFGIRYNSSYYMNITSATGGYSSLSLNLSAYSGYLPITYFFKCSGQNLFLQNVSYYVTATPPQNNATFETGMQQINESPAISFMLKVFIMLIAIIVGLLIAWEIGLPPISYGFVSTIILCMFTFYPVQWIPVAFTIVCGVALIGGSLVTNQGGEMYG